MTRWIAPAFLCLLCAVPAGAQDAADSVAPEAATRLPAAFEGLSPEAEAAFRVKSDNKSVKAEEWMVAAANPLAVQAGAKVLGDGGSAADAMVAVQAVLGLVEPQSSGLGGGAFLVWYDGETGELTTLDARETAPLGATPRLFQDAGGEPLKFWDAVVGGLSVGTPGTPKLLEEAHRRWGRANWTGLFSEAIELAETGFRVSPRLAELVDGDQERLQSAPATAAYFMPGGQPIRAGDRLRNPDYAATLRAIAAEGSGAFYAGEIARDIVTTVREAATPGELSAVDLALYKVIERPAVCADYRDFDICGMGPPSSGGLTVGQILGLLEGFDLAGMGPDSPNAWRLIGDASRLAFADRGRYMADSDFVPVPAEGLLAPDYLASRAALLKRGKALPEVEPGAPEWDHAQLWADDESIEFPSTSHISIIDAYGNALSMTTTIENGFGSRLMVRGFLLNNELTDFSFKSHADGVPIANRVAPGKRPRSSMAPTIVLRDGRPRLVIGSPGGSRIIGYVAQAIIAHLDWKMGVQPALAMPHLVNRFGTYDIEEGTEAEGLATRLDEMGFKTNLRALNSGLHAIAVRPTGLAGGADPRREGIAIGK
ncbi:gamma-glutamyltranspeptidase/glutathione hydrolase [Aliiruegeria haliotis]|uniref:Glutathione hydrolase proenzyme n=1 Tax=Aliiruegeria haliotis TaxID=1280846 RepID=A0A2T0RY84_9RHOB|nr:gamma-glutamyltransferase [Aliiruegeria haliotis]PRY26128.1 gamma-glutamyltranspeptidase/glutathione hydrolase [Aliiruegeria haliotis]